MKSGLQAGPRVLDRVAATIARYHMFEAGQKVGIVTNDQAYELVDTHALRAQGFEVGEVPGACFCCKFDDLLETTNRLQQDDAPDIILAEPVGSCTDLVATVVEPMRHLYGEQYEVGPLAVLLRIVERLIWMIEGAHQR